MKIILAQGNPESRYSGTRHNVGFAVIDAFAASYDLSWSDKSKFRALIAETTIGDEKVILAKPTTYYNETGQAARALVDFYNIDPATDVLVIHDELALPIGTVRTRKQGSDAGNNGVKSLTNHIGQDYSRIRIGISNEHREKTGDVDFVLGKFTKTESETFKNLTPDIFGYIMDFIHGQLPHETKSL
jgi:PTH1 family peptidyl-tRNA hydrolase